MNFVNLPASVAGGYGSRRPARQAGRQPACRSAGLLWSRQVDKGSAQSVGDFAKSNTYFIRTHLRQGCGGQSIRI
jgi:hypothetical protein